MIHNFNMLVIMNGWEPLKVFNKSEEETDSLKKYLTPWPIWVSHDTHFCQIIWQIWSYTEQNTFCQKLPPVGFELTTSGSAVSCSANSARSLFGCLCELKAFIKSCPVDSRNKQIPTCEMVHETKESSLQKFPTDSSLAQLEEHETDDPEVMSSNPSGGNLFCSV